MVSVSCTIICINGGRRRSSAICSSNCGAGDSGSSDSSSSGSTNISSISSGVNGAIKVAL